MILFQHLGLVIQLLEIFFEIYIFATLDYFHWSKGLSFLYLSLFIIMFAYLLLICFVIEIMSE